MALTRLIGIVGVGLGLAILMPGPPAIAQGGLAAYQGAWLSGDANCADIFVPAGKGMAFKKSIDVFATAFIVSGSRLRTPLASCNIKSSRPSGDRQLLVLDCTNSVSESEVRLLLALQPDGSLKRYMKGDDDISTDYRLCSR